MGTQVNEQTRVRVADNVFAREFDGEMVLVDLERGDYFGLNEVGARAWSKLVMGLSVGEIASSLVADYEVDRSALVVDLNHLIDALVERGLVVLVEP